jgi:ferredoxin
MPVAILPDISEQHCIGCALCVEICTALGPDVLRVKPVEGWKRGKAFVFYPERCISDGACIGVCPTRPTDSIEEECSIYEGLGRRLILRPQILKNFSFFNFYNFILLIFCCTQYIVCSNQAQASSTNNLYQTNTLT